MKEKNVAAIVVTYNRFILLQECIESLRTQSYHDMSIIVVNNGSTDETSGWLEKQKDLIVINQKNVGGAGGFFTGIKYACEHGFKFSWVMDDDVVADVNALANLICHTDKIEGFLCSRVLDTNMKMCNVPKISLRKSKETNELQWGNMLQENLLMVDVASFVSVLIPSKLVYEIGLPLKQYYIWGDDTEYTTRISSKYISYMATNSQVIHKRKIQKTLSIFTETDINRLNNYFYFYRNRISSQKTLLKKLIFWGYSILQAFQLLLAFRGNASYIVLKGTCASLFFHPSIEYPKIC